MVNHIQCLLCSALDYQGPVELLGFVSPIDRLGISGACPYLIDITYFSHTLDPVKLSRGPRVLPTMTYDNVKSDEQFDIIFIPGGTGMIRAHYKIGAQ